MRSIEIPKPEERDWRYRFFEILPGALTWTILAMPFILSWLDPTAAAYFIFGYLLLWFIRALSLNIRSIQGWQMMNEHKNAPWQKLNQDLEVLEVNTKNPPAWHARNLDRVREYIGDKRLKPSEVIHVAVIAAYNEPLEILEPTIQSVLKSDYDMRKVMLVLAYEGRDGARSEEACLQLIKKYGKRFMYADAVKHPVTPGEVRGKGPNITFAAKKLEKYLRAQKIDLRRVMLTTLDADNRPDKQYFAALTYTFCSTEEPKYASYQPIIMYTNNIWDAPAPMRVIATGNGFWNLVLTTRVHMLRNFSSHGQPMEALVDTDYWSVRSIVEDGHQYWRTWFRYDGKHDVFPIYVPIYQDAVLSHTYRRTLRVQFLQIRRWAYGASDIAYVGYTGFVKPNNIPKWKIWPKFLRLLEGHISWSTAPLLLLLASFIPALVNPNLFYLDPQSYLVQQIPRLASRLQQIAMVGILVTLFLSLQALPPKPERYKRHRTLWMILQWIYLPFTTIIFNACAAINSQTRLMFGKYLDNFDVTDKAVVKR